MSEILNSIDSPDDIKKLDFNQMESLSEEIREFLIEKVSKTGGHLASNLGVVELTLALHKVFNSPQDKIIWDVGHQSYIHKIITGRKDKFDTLRKLDGLAGFPKFTESPHDWFNTGHSSTSISAALGIARARDIKKENYSVIAVIGDGALTGGMAFEALNDAGRSLNNIIVILNDNEMSIGKNVGGLSRYLSKIRTEPLYSKVKKDVESLLDRIPLIGKGAAKILSRAKGTIKYMVVPGMLFEELGFKYLGPIDGHNIVELNDVLTQAKRSSGPVLIHVCTQKGKGFSFAEENPHDFHAVPPFEIETGEAISTSGPGYSDIFGGELARLAQTDESVVAITAAMQQGTGLSEFSKKYPNRFFDVGIAEQHAVTFAAGLARNGLKPVVAVYSTFLQRAYDQIMHDVAVQNLNVLLAIDRAGLVGEDGETHQGLYDLSYLNNIPNMTVMAPSDYNELKGMLDFTLKNRFGPVAIRYPRGKGKDSIFAYFDIEYGKGVCLRSGKDVTLAAVGNMVETALKTAELLERKGISAEIINARFVKPIDSELIISSAAKTKKVITLEDNSIIGGFGSNVLKLLNDSGTGAAVRTLGYPDKFIPHGSRNDITRKYGLDPESIAAYITDMLA